MLDPALRAPAPPRCCWAAIPSLLGNPTKAHPNSFAEHPPRLQACQTAVDPMCSACETPGMCWEMPLENTAINPGLAVESCPGRDIPLDTGGLRNLIVIPTHLPSSSSSPQTLLSHSSSLEWLTPYGMTLPHSPLRCWCSQENKGALHGNRAQKLHWGHRLQMWNICCGGCHQLSTALGCTQPADKWGQCTEGEV